jgi:endonuclease YncB( thermonuclease family)
MRKRKNGGAVIVGIVALGIVISCGNSSDPPTSTHPAPVQNTVAESMVTMKATPVPITAYGPDFNVDEANLAVTRVIDGDTFEVTGGRRVRVLGIDSCEMSTAGGKEAKETAEILLAGSQVVLTAQPGAPDKDRYGRLLRYVAVGSNGSDFGESMVIYDHTAVYAGKNDASPEYVARLRSLDFEGRNCAGTAVAADDGDTTVIVKGGDDDHHRGWVRRHVCRHIFGC